MAGWVGGCQARPRAQRPHPRPTPPQPPAAKSAKSDYDRVGSFCGPAFLAANALGGFGGRVTPLQTAVVVFGWWQAQQLPAFTGSTWVYMASLAAAVYKNLAAEASVGVGGLASGGGGGAHAQPVDLPASPNSPTHPPIRPLPLLQWLVAAFGVSALWSLYQGWAEGGGASKLRFQHALFAALAGWAFYSGAATPVALFIMMGQLVASVVA